MSYKKTASLYFPSNRSRIFRDLLCPGQIRKFEFLRLKWQSIAFLRLNRKLFLHMILLFASRFRYIYFVHQSAGVRMEVDFDYSALVHGDRFFSTCWLFSSKYYKYFLHQTNFVRQNIFFYGKNIFSVTKPRLKTSVLNNFFAKIVEHIPFS